MIAPTEARDPTLKRQAVDEWGTVAKGIANGKSYIRFSKVRQRARYSPRLGRPFLPPPPALV